MLLFYIYSVTSGIGNLQFLFYAGHMPGCIVLDNSLNQKCHLTFLKATGLSTPTA